MIHPTFERARRIRDANAAVVSIGVVIVVVFAPFVALVRDGSGDPSEAVLTLSWWAGTVILSGYGVVHILAGLADTRQFLDDYGTDYAGAGVVFCHALGQRLLVLITIGIALVVLAILGTGVGAPFVLLIILGLFGTILLGPPTAVPMNRRVSERLTEYRDK